MGAEPLRSFYVESFEPLKLRGRASRTKQLYVTTLRNFEKFLNREPELSDLSDETVSRYLSWFRSLPRSPLSVNKERNNLLAIWRFGCRKRRIDLWPDVEPEIEPERIPQAWTEDEIRRLFASIHQETGWIAGVPAAAWWAALHYVAWDSGERISAMRALLWSHVDLTGAALYVPAELRKGKRKDRLYKLAPDTVDALKAIRMPPRAEVFPWPYCPTYLYNLYVPILKRAGLPHDCRSKFHRMRRSVASHYEAAGGNATELLGHSGRKVTKSYLDPRIVGDKQATDLLFRPGNRAG